MIPTFVHIEKTGGTTLIHTLRRNFPFGHCDIIPSDPSANVISEKDLGKARRMYPGLKSLAGHSIKPFLDLGSHGPDLSFYTVLRNGTDRYVSEYYHDFFKRGFDDGFEAWMKFDERWNHQTRSLCGTDDLAAAKTILEEKFTVVGVLEKYQDFVDSVATLFEAQAFDTTFTRLNKAGLSDAAGVRHHRCRQARAKPARPQAARSAPSTATATACAPAPKGTATARWPRRRTPCHRQSGGPRRGHRFPAE